MTKAEELKEQLAVIEHERWGDWQRWMHMQCATNEDGSITIPAALVERWERQIDTPYAELSDKEKRSDMDQVDRYWPLVEAFILESVKKAKSEIQDPNRFVRRPHE